MCSVPDGESAKALVQNKGERNSMSITAKVVRSTIRLTNGLVNMFVLLVILLLLTFSCYAIWDSHQIYRAANAGNYDIYRPTAEDATASFEELRLINPDVMAWLTVYGTNIDYPVVQGQNNFTYVNRDVKGNNSPSGAIFLDYRCSSSFSDFNSILYGHHMNNRVMFGEITDFSDKDYFEARRYGLVFVDGEEHGLEFFAFVQADAYDFGVFRVAISEQEERQAYLSLLLDKAIHTRPDMSVTINDRIILLSTCSPDATNGRDILIAKITDNPNPNPFAVETTELQNILPAVDGLSTLWVQVPLWMRVTVIGLPLLPILLLVMKKLRKRTMKKASH